MQMWMIGESGFGQATFEDKIPTSAYYKEPSTQPSSAMMNYNYQGLGLPMVYYIDVTTMLLQISSNITGEITCDSSPGGICELAHGCGTYIDEGLWDLSFRFKFMDNKNYIIFPLAAFAKDDLEDGKCKIFIQANQQDSYMSDSVIFGALFLQMY